MALLPSLPDRIKRLIPPGWFARDSSVPVRNAVLGGLTDGLSWITGRQAYARAQTRIRTASGLFLDLVAWDFFGARFMRRKGELDEPFRARILKEMFRPRNTRAAIVAAVTDLTGRPPTIVELWNPGDCGAYDTPFLAYAGEASGNGPLSGYNTTASAYDAGGTFAYVTPEPPVSAAPGAGRWGSYDFPNQMLITAHRGVVDIERDGCGGFDTPALAYSDVSSGVVAAGFYVEDAPTSAASDAEIYAAIAATVAGGNVAWVAIEN